MQTRRLTADDAEAYFALRLHALQDAPTASWASYDEERQLSLASIAARLPCAGVQASFGLFLQGALAGIASLKHDDSDKIRHRANLWGVYILPQARGQGAARQLIAALIDHAARVPQLRQLTLVVSCTNAAAVRLYSSLGFIMTGMERDSIFVDGAYHDELRMVKFLPARPA